MDHGCPVGFCDQVPQMGRLRTTEKYSRKVLEARSQTQVSPGLAPSRGSKGESVSQPPVSSVTHPWHSWAHGGTTLTSALTSPDLCLDLHLHVVFSLCVHCCIFYVSKFASLIRTPATGLGPSLTKYDLINLIVSAKT